LHPLLLLIEVIVVLLRLLRLLLPIEVFVVLLLQSIEVVGGRGASKVRRREGGRGKGSESGECSS